MFSCEFYEISKNTPYDRTPLVAASEARDNFIAINNYCQVLINFVNQNLSQSSTSSGFSDMTGGRGKYCCVPECGSVRYNKSGNKTLINLFKFPSKAKIKSLKSTRGGSRLLICIEGEVVEPRLTHLAKMQLYVNNNLSKNI